MTNEQTIPNPGRRRQDAARSSDRTTSSSPAPGGRLSRRALWCLGALLLAAAGLRAWTVIALASDLRIRQPVLDGFYYLELAQRLAAGGDWPPGPIFMTPFYPAILSLLFRAGLGGVLAVQLLQAALGVASVALGFAVIRRDLGARAAWAAAALGALCGPILAMESQVLTESLLFFLATAALWFWPRPADGARRPLLFGVLCGLLATGRGVFLLLPAAAVASIWARNLRRGRALTGGRGIGPRAASVLTAWVASGVLLSLLPLAVRQTRTTGELRILTLNGGLNLYVGNNPWARGLYSPPPGIDLSQDPTATRSASLAAGRELSLAESDRHYTRAALGFLAAQPGRALWLLSRKALLYFSPHEIPQIEVYSLLRRAAPPLRAAFIDFRWILPLALLGLASALSRRGKAEGDGPRLEPVLLLAATGWVATILFFATGRYRVPFLPAFLGLAGLGAAALVETLRARRARPMLLVLPAAVLLQFALPTYPRAKAEAFDHHQLGVRLEREGRLEEALQAHRRAAELWPEDGAAWHGAGVTLVRLGRLPEAVEAYRRALERMPDSAVAHYNLGATYGRMGDDPRALEEFREAVRLDPWDPRYHSDLGIALARTGHREEGIQELRRALERDPGHAPARRALEALGAAP